MVFYRFSSDSMSTNLNKLHKQMTGASSNNSKVDEEQQNTIASDEWVDKFNLNYSDINEEPAAMSSEISFDSDLERCALEEGDSYG